MNIPQIMERNVLHTGKVFIKEQEEHSRAYIIQSGRVRSFKMQGEQKIPIKEYGPNTIIGEANLLEDKPADKSYEAVRETTVITITRQDFEKRLQKSDTIIQTVFQHMMAKMEILLSEQEAERTRKLDIDENAFLIVREMTKNVSDDQKRRYELALLPHINAIMKSVKSLK